MRFFVSVTFRVNTDQGPKIARRVYMCPTAKARAAIIQRFRSAKAIERGELVGELRQQLAPFGREYWCAAPPAGIPDEIQAAHPGIYRVMIAAKGSDRPNIDRMQEPQL